MFLLGAKEEKSTSLDDKKSIENLKVQKYFIEQIS